MSAAAPQAPALPTAMSAQQLPVVDLHPFLFGNAAERLAVAQQIADACENYGFFYLRRHGVPSETIAGGFAAARQIFERPLEERLACRVTTPRQNRGYQPMFDTAAGGGVSDFKESFDMGFPLPHDDPDMAAGLPFHAPNAWPDLPDFQPQVHGLYFALLHCGRQVLRAMALALGTDENFFVGHCEKPTTNLRLIHYPPQAADPEAGIGARAHADKGLITLLLNDTVGGLHVLSSERQWIVAPPDPQAIIVNVGDLMTRWTNGRFRSALHRVVNATGHERFSIPQFHHPSFHTVVDPLALTPEAKPRFEPVVAGEFVASGFKRDRKSWAGAETSPA